MMIWSDITAIQEHHQELLREAEKERLVRQLLVKRNKPSLWQNISNLIFGSTRPDNR